MNRTDVKGIIEATVKKHGFKIEWISGLFSPHIVSDEMNFFIAPASTENTDWDARRLEFRLTVGAAVRKMGGNPTVEDLLKTADEIRRGAELVKELQDMNVTWIETY